jgi:nucleotide-binding universal stress UspA family protein
MKILVAYDASKYSEAALDDLIKAGLPDSGEFLVVSVVEGWLMPETSGQALALDENSEVKTLATHAVLRLQKMFPQWKVSAEITCGSASFGILKKSREFRPDLIIVGSHGRSAVGHFFLGSISNKVLGESNCSVRIARGEVEIEPSPTRLLIGYDGSIGANSAVEAVISRNWNKDCEFKLVIATNSLLPLTIGRFSPVKIESVEVEVKNKEEWLEKLAESALQKLGDAGYIASLHIYRGNPKQVLIDEAIKWKADCIFIGANRFGNQIERFSLGSVAAAVAARANCSVEVVRHKIYW